MRIALWKTLCIGLVGAALASAVPLGKAVGGDAKTLFEEVCSVCHSTDIPKAQKKTLPEWEDLVSTMRSYGASLSDDEAKLLCQHLAKEYGKN